MKTISENRCFGGVQGVYSHASHACGCDMTFGLYLPPQAAQGTLPLHAQQLRLAPREQQVAEATARMRRRTRPWAWAKLVACQKLPAKIGGRNSAMAR